MRLSTRLKNLESDQPDSGLSRDESMFLVSLLARRDALFWPWRMVGNSTPHSEIRHRQREYLAGSVGLHAKADGRQQWKAVHFMRQRLIAAGFISAIHSGGQVSSVFLTPLGEATARALVGDRLCSFQRAKIALALILLRCKGQETTACSESQLFGRELHGCPNDWDDETETVLPLLTCGIVACESDSQGRAIYIPRMEVAEPEHVQVDTASIDELDSLYVKSFNDERKFLESVEPRDPSEVVIPNPRGWPWVK